ncbi:glycosyltransferase family 31 protein [Hypomontagnella monticulosa]|nr:glycosyltransferase family 31 protein [Hypomontagnella monticulosa]
MFRSIAPYGRARTLQILASFLIFCILLSTLRLYSRQPPPVPSIYEYTDGKTRGGRQNETGSNNVPPPSDETAYLRYLVREHSLTNEVPWLARRLKVQFDAKTRKSMTEVPNLRFARPDFRRVRADDERLDLSAEKPVPIALTPSVMPDQVDASGLLFGISTSYDRLSYGNSSLIRDWARWLTDGKGKSNGASLVLTLHRTTSAEIDYVTSKLQEAGIEAAVFPAENTQDSSGRYLDLVGLLARRNTELSGDGREKKFLALIDDDVFFPSLSKLLARLGKFSSKKKTYLGLPSERADWTIENNVTLTYGGGAVFLTPPMAEAVSQLPCLNSTETTRTGQWDETLYNCIAAHTDEKLHIIPSLYAPGDDAYGLRTGYESGLAPLALHHYKHRHRFDAGKAHAVASLCGEACFLQRFFFREDGWVLVNGHSIAQYPDGVAVAPASKSLGKSDINSKDKPRVSLKVGDRLVLDKEDDSDKRLDGRMVVSWAGTKRTWRLLDSRIGAAGEVWQAYVKRKGSPVTYGDEDDRLPEDDTVHTQDGPSDVDSVIVLIWEP